jgi:hypothetical protein
VDLEHSQVASADDQHDFCRQIEAYLCRKNDGHLVRIVGPAFDQVCGWAAKGVPFKVACRGIDRYFERYYAKGPRRRPVRVEFCEADVLDVFDEWRRAVGVPATEPVVETKHGSLPAHLERVIARLTTLRAGESRPFDPVLDHLIRELDAVRATAKGLRGEARHALVERLRILDGELIAAARSACDAQTIGELLAEADRELAPFRARMPADAYQQSRDACVNRLVRDRLRLPIVSFE